jgi:hypothetical protein
MTKIENLGIPSIDSLKLRFELSTLESYDKSIEDIRRDYNCTTQELEGEEFKKNSKSYKLGYKGFQFYASIQNIIVRQNTAVPCLTILVNSKHLKERYFEGITIDNYHLIYNEVIKLGILKCNYDTFCNGVGTDIDVKIDYQIALDEYKEMINALEIMTKQSSKSGKGCNAIKKPNNYGIEWSKRITTQYKTNPFFKVYHKQIELEHHSAEFNNEYLKGIDIENTFRIEATIKNKEHLKRLDLGLNNYTIIEILSLPKEQLMKVISTAINSHLMPRSKATTFKGRGNLTPSNELLLDFIMIATNDLNWSFNRIENHVLRNDEDKNRKHRKKKLITQLYTDHIQGTNFDAKTTKIDSIFNTLGWL